MAVGVRLLMLVFVASLAAGLDVPLRSPLTTVVPVEDPLAGPREVSARIIVPADAPADLGVGLVVRDRDGRWFQRLRSAPLRHGVNDLRLTLDDVHPADAHPLATTLSAADLAVCTRSGLILWSAQASTASITVEDLVVRPLEPDVGTGRLQDLAVDGFVGGACHVNTGERWTASVVPDPFPANPYDAEAFALDLVVEGPDGIRRIPGFFEQDVVLEDRGDREADTRHGRSRFSLRFRPAQPGTYDLRLEATWGDGRQVVTDLPDLVVSGAAVDTLVRVDEDRRFFTTGGEFWWPIGINLHSTYDLRSRDVLETTLTPHRGSLVYTALFPRLAAAGMDACEIWMSSWNLGLEWRADWPGFEGAGRFAQGNAARMDRVLDAAWAAGLRVNLVINNHGQASPKADREWKDNPYNRENGGLIERPEEIFSDAGVAALQERLRRYLVGRYADHPAVLGWKLWSEVDLTAGRGEPLIRWHDEAAKRWQALDTYGHACTTHWCGTYTHVNPGIAALDSIGYLCIDAYRGTSRDGSGWRSMPQLLADSLYDASRGLERWKKPLLTTEYGASGKAPLAMRQVDLRLASFSAFVSGHAGAPMTWWWEWVDQHGLWDSYRAIRAFTAGEDLRGADARSVALQATVGSDPLWCRAWVRPGRLLVHLVDDRYATTGEERLLNGAQITVGSSVAAGRMQVEWWDADRGVVLQSTTWEHTGGTLTLTAPEFSGHLAVKCWRAEDDSVDG